MRTRKGRGEGAGPGPDPDPDPDQDQETEPIAGRRLHTQIAAGTPNEQDKTVGQGPGLDLVVGLDRRGEAEVEVEGREEGGGGVEAGRGMEEAERGKREEMKVGGGMQGMQPKIGPKSYLAMTQW